MPADSFVPLSDLVDQLAEIEGLPLDRIVAPLQDVALLEDIGFTAYESSESGTVHTEAITLAFRREFSFELAGLAGLEIVLGGSGTFTEIPLELSLDTSSGVAFHEARLTGIVTVRFPESWLKPMRRNGAGEWEPDPGATRRELQYSGTVVIDSGGGVSFTGSNSFSLPPSMIGDTGVIIEASNVTLVFSDADIPAGAPAGFRRGVFIASATLSMRDSGFPVQGVTISNAYFGSGGFTASIDVTTNIAGTLGGFDFTLTHFGLDFVQNSLVGSDVRGSLTVPYFDDTLDVGLSIASNGDFSVALSTASGLEVLEIAGLLHVRLSAVEFGVRGGIPEVALSGTLALQEIGGLDFPDFELRRLTINSRGEVTIEGGWIDLGDALAFDFHGFQMELTRIGFGTEVATDENWIGLSGTIQLSQGLAVGGSVDGLRIWWTRSGPPSVRVTVEGVGVALTIPDVLEFDGYVRFLNDPATSTLGFAGDIHLTLPTLNFSGEASLLVGRRGSDPFFYIAVSVDLPLGIPLAQTGVAFYGFQGLVGYNVFPSKTPEQHWYEDWYLTPTAGVTQSTKWTPQVPAFAVGLGATLGTFPDNGFAVSGRVLIALVLPGPILIIEGRANILSPRSELASSDPSKPLFRALMVLDGREGTFLMNIGAQYNRDPLIRIGGTMEAFFDFNDLFAWHLYLGVDEPREKRIQATVLSILQAQSYWMLTARDLRFGAWVGYDKRWKFGPLEVVLQAWLDGGARVGFAPVQIAGYLELHGAVSLRAFGIGVGLSITARLEAEAPRPFRVKGEFRVAINLPWPLDDIGATVTIQWSGDTGDPEFLADPLVKSVTLEHALTGGSWSGGPAIIPRVPPDARPVVSFERPVRDSVHMFAGAGSYLPERCGKYEFEHQLVEVALADLSTGAPVPVRGVWKAAATPDGTPCSKLELFGRSAFTYHGSSNLEYFQEFGVWLPLYPCGPDVGSDKPTCIEFPGASRLGSIRDPIRFAPLTIVPGPRDRLTGGLAGPQGGEREAVLLHVARSTSARFDVPVESVTVALWAGAELRIEGLRAGSTVTTVSVAPMERFQTVPVPGELDELRFQGAEAALVQVCWRPAGEAERARELQRYRQTTAESVEQWYSEEELFTPGHRYRLTVRVRSTRTPSSGPSTRDYTGELTFDVAAAPALTPLPDWTPPDTGDAGPGNPYATLAPYVLRTVPRDGERPVYRSYDVSVDFNQNYVESLYTGDLRIRLFAPGDREVTPTSGLPSRWGRGRDLFLHETERFWLETVDRMTCVPVDVDYSQIVRNTNLRTDAAALDLEPELRHEARLFASGREAYRFSFVTSRYRNFAEHMDSYRGTNWVETIAVPDPTLLEPLVAAARAGGMSFDPAEPPAFEQLYYDVLGLSARGFPARVEWIELRSAAGGHALLFSSPEPVAWERVSITVQRRRRIRVGALIHVVLQPVETVWVRHADGSRALVFFPSAAEAAGLLPSGQFQVNYTFLRDAGASLPVLSVAGDTSPETAQHVLSMPTLTGPPS